jgi:hypothetical protein
MSSYLAFWYLHGIPHSCEICPRTIKKKGYFKAYVKSNEVYAQQGGVIK